MILYPLGWVDFIRLSWRFDIRCIRSLTYMFKVRTARGWSRRSNVNTFSLVWKSWLTLPVSYTLLFSRVLFVFNYASPLLPPCVCSGGRRKITSIDLSMENISLLSEQNCKPTHKLLRKEAKAERSLSFLYVICGCRYHMIHLLTILLHRQKIAQAMIQTILNRFVTNKRNSRVIGGRKTH